MSASISMLVSTLIAAVLLPPMGACTLAQLNQQVDAGQARVDEKQQALNAEQVRQAELQQEMMSLSTELSQRQLSLDDLNARLERLRQQNANASEATAAQQAHKRRVQTQIKSYQDQIAALRHNPTLSDDQKRAKSAYLQNEIRKALQQMVLS